MDQLVHVIKVSSQLSLFVVAAAFFIFFVILHALIEDKSPSLSSSLLKPKQLCSCCRLWTQSMERLRKHLELLSDSRIKPC